MLWDEVKFEYRSIKMKYLICRPHTTVICNVFAHSHPSINLKKISLHLHKYRHKSYKHLLQFDNSHEFHECLGSLSNHIDGWSTSFAPWSLLLFLNPTSCANSHIRRTDALKTGELLQFRSSCYLRIPIFLCSVCLERDKLLQATCRHSFSEAGSSDNGNFYHTPTRSSTISSKATQSQISSRSIVFEMRKLIRAETATAHIRLQRDKRILFESSRSMPRRCVDCASVIGL